MPITGNPTLFPMLEPGPRVPDGVILHPQAVPLREQRELHRIILDIAASAPFRKPRTPGGGVTSAAMTNCGTVGWWSDSKGYRYLPHQPESTAPWPPIPALFRALVARAVAGTPWAAFTPDACLINFYEPGAKMGLHQDKDERDFTQPIVTVSLGDEADFLMGGFARTDKAAVLRLASGDVLVMGGASRMRFHGVRKIHPGTSPLPGVAGRYSLTFRKAL